MNDFPIDEAYLIGGWCASALWGMLTCLVIYCLSVIVPRFRKGNVNRTHYITTVAVIVLYMLSTTHLSLVLRRLIEGFIQHRDNPKIYFADIGIPLNRAKDEIYITSMIIADTVVVWRCWIVWGKNNFVIAAPASLVLGTIITGYAGVGQYFLAHPNPQTAVNWGTSMFATSLATNVLVILLTAGRIWWLSRWVSRDNFGPIATKYRAIVLLVVESGAVIAAAKVTEFVLFRLASGSGLVGLNALYIVYEMLPHLNAVMPTIIIIFVNAGKGLGDDHGTKARAVSSGVIFARRATKIGPSTTEYELQTRSATNGALQSASSVSHIQFEEAKTVLSPDFSDLEDGQALHLDVNIADRV